MKKVLLIAGGGAIGTHVGTELISMGHQVEVLCLEDRISSHERLTFYKEKVDLAFLERFLQGKRYDAIVNFLHYVYAQDYASYHELLCAHTDHLVVLSSYRVYADLEHPVTESAPRLDRVIKDDPDFINHETYTMGKIRCEDYIHQVSKTKNWTIVRPVISSACNRFDLVMHSGLTLIKAAREGRVLPLPEKARRLVAGLDWAGNTGKSIAHLLFKPQCLQETYSISSGQNLTWEEIAGYYRDILGLQVEWLEESAYEKLEQDKYRLIYDRLYSRDMDCSKLFAATQLTKADFLPIKEGILYELAQLKAASV